jgi:hypothetical protein
MRYTTILILSILFSFGCSTTKMVSYKTVDNKGKKFTYKVRIPKRFTTKETDYENERFKMFSYTDSSRFFFSDNIAPSSFYPDAYKKYGKDINLKFLSVDTITINGIDNKGNLWKERKAGIIVYGYSQVPPEKEAVFDRILDNVITTK